MKALIQSHKSVEFYLISSLLVSSSLHNNVVSFLENDFALPFKFLNS